MNMVNDNYIKVESPVKHSKKQIDSAHLM